MIDVLRTAINIYKDAPNLLNKLKDKQVGNKI